MASLIALTPEDVGRILPELAGERVKHCACRIAEDRLWLDLSVETNISILGRLPVTISVRAELESAATIGVNVRVEKAMGVAAFVQPFLKSIMAHIVPESARGFVDVESNTRVVVHLDRMEINGRSLLGQIRVESVQVPEGAHAAALGFELLEGSVIGLFRAEAAVVS